VQTKLKRKLLTTLLTIVCLCYSAVGVYTATHWLLATMHIIFSVSMVAWYSHYMELWGNAGRYYAAWKARYVLYRMVKKRGVVPLSQRMRILRSGFASGGVVPRTEPNDTARRRMGGSMPDSIVNPVREWDTSRARELGAPTRPPPRPLLPPRPFLSNSTDEQVLDRIRRADITVGDLTSDGGLLDPEQSAEFIRNMAQQSDFSELEARVVAGGASLDDLLVFNVSEDSGDPVDERLEEVTDALADEVLRDLDEERVVRLDYSAQHMRDGIISFITEWRRQYTDLAVDSGNHDEIAFLNQVVEAVNTQYPEPVMNTFDPDTDPSDAVEDIAEVIRVDELEDESLLERIRISLLNFIREDSFATQYIHPSATQYIQDIIGRVDRQLNIFHGFTNLIEAGREAEAVEACVNALLPRVHNAMAQSGDSSVPVVSQEDNDWVEREVREYVARRLEPAVTTSAVTGEGSGNIWERAFIHRGNSSTDISGAEIHSHRIPDGRVHIPDNLLPKNINDPRKGRELMPTKRMIKTRRKPVDYSDK